MRVLVFERICEYIDRQIHEESLKRKGAVRSFLYREK